MYIHVYITLSVSKTQGCQCWFDNPMLSGHSSLDGLMRRGSILFTRVAYTKLVQKWPMSTEFGNTPGIVLKEHRPLPI